MLKTIPVAAVGCLSLTLALFSAGHATEAAPEQEPPPPEIHRSIDPIVLRGADMPSLQGLPIESLRLAAYKNGVLSAIPYQVDERGPDGQYLFRTSHPDQGDDEPGKLDANDELAFMVRDAGDRLPESQFAGNQLLAEIETRDPLDGARAWCYVGTAGRFPQPSSVDYVSYDPESDRILSRYYRIGFSREAPISYGDTTITLEGNGNGARINERVLTRLNAKLKLLGIHLKKSEADFRSLRKGYIDGPVRVIKRVGNSMRAVFGIYGPEAVVDYTFYLANWIMPTDLYLPVDVSKFCSELSLRGGTHWTTDARGMVFYTKYIEPGAAVIDGKTSEAEKNMDLRLDVDHIWHLYTGALNGTGQGSILFRILLDENLQKHLTATTYFYDKRTEEAFEGDPVTEDLYDFYFEGSYLWTGMETLPKGHYSITSWATVMPDFHTPGDEQRYLDVLDRPLEVTVRPAPPPTAAPCVSDPGT